MLDRWSSTWCRPWLQRGAAALQRTGVGADQVSVAGFLVGLLAMIAIASHHYLAGLAAILVNRCADGLDGALARQGSATDAGAYLDIVLDFIFYGGVVFAFALAEPARNSLGAALLLFSFLGTGCSFLAYAILAERRTLTSVRYPHKGFYYLGGLTEGTETILFFILFCLFPGAFPHLAIFFSVLCLITTITRVVGGYLTLRAEERRQERGE